MKVCVYAICKNESQFVERWMASMGEADAVVVLDTGSTDDTVERFDPWRFDTARNRSLDLVPEDADICVCTDLDEVLHPGWRALLEAAWVPGTTRATYRYTWNFLPDGREGHVFWYSKVHARHGYRWTHPVHEVLTPDPGLVEHVVTVPGMQLDHHADESKSRAQYLPLLELSVQEDPEDDRNMHYLGREYMFRGQWEKAIATLKRHLSLPRATWRDERCASMRFLARCCQAMGQEGEAEARKKAFAGFQINEELMACAKPDAMVLHCLPAHRGEEITEGVFESHAGQIFDEAENRLHAQKAVMVTLLAPQK